MSNTKIICKLTRLSWHQFPPHLMHSSQLKVESVLLQTSPYTSCTAISTITKKHTLAMVLIFEFKTVNLSQNFTNNTANFFLICELKDVSRFVRNPKCARSASRVSTDCIEVTSRVSWVYSPATWDESSSRAGGKFAEIALYESIASKCALIYSYWLDFLDFVLRMACWRNYWIKY